MMTKTRSLTSIAAHAMAAIALAGMMAAPAQLAAQQAGAPVSKTVLTVSTAALGLPALTLRPSDAIGDVTYCEFTIETSDVRYYYTSGDTPTGTSGHIWYAGATYSLGGIAALRNWRSIRISTASSDATVTASCWK